MWDLLSALNILLIALPILFLYWYKRPSRNFPPGPRGFPLVGVLPYLSEHVGKDFKKWSLEKYGPVMSVRLGRKEAVILNTCDTIREVFVKNGKSTTDRPNIEVFARKLGKYGITFRKYDEIYKAQKTFVLKHLLGKNSLNLDIERLLEDEGDKFIEHLKKLSHMPEIDMKNQLYSITANVIYRMLLDKRYDYDDPQFDKLKAAMTGVLSHPDDAAPVGFLDIMPFLIYFPPFSGAANRVSDRIEFIINTIQSDTEKSKKVADLNNPKNFPQSFFAEQKFGKKIEERGFNEDKRLAVVCADIFIGGSEITSASLAWMFVYLFNFPKYYKQIEKEIDNAFASCGKLSMEMQSNMPITCAFIQEVMRHKTLSICGVPHMTTKNIAVGGYVIPKGTKVLGNIYGAHWDSKTWPNPEQFNPHRHIDEDGKFVDSKNIIPFFVGLKYCLGESLARKEIFFYFVKILKNFKISCANIFPPPLNKEIISISVSPKRLMVKLEPK